MKYCFRWLLILGMVLLFAPRLYADVRLPGIFGSHMVLQRDVPVKIWGWAEKREKIELLLGPDTYLVRADREGKWEITLKPMPAGGPYDIVILGNNDIYLKDVLFGDVWVCSGQSNMQWSLQQTGYEVTDTASLATANVRLFTVRIDTDYMPREDVAGGEWKRLSKKSLMPFSAVAYHFGNTLHQEMGVPIGLINSSLGATAIETWMSHESLMEFDQFVPEISPIVQRAKNFAEMNAGFELIRRTWEQNHYLKGPGMEERWYRPETDLSQWKEMDIPGFWEEQAPELAKHDGAVWFRREFDLPQDFSGDQYLLALNQLDDYDIAWVNGVKVGETFGRHNFRNYYVEAKLLKPKGNVLVVRIFDTGGQGGFSTSSFWGNPLIWGKWKYRKGLPINAATFPRVELPNVSPFSSPGVLYNANIAPLTRLPIKGAIWYQGESNADRAYEYRELFPALIRDWRQKWGQGDFPFLFVQLANYREEPATPQPSTWAELREAQTLALQLPHTGMAVTIDIGEAGDIHPRNKAEVGRRLGLAALSVAYDQHPITSSPIYASHRVYRNRCVIQFDNVGEGLKARDKYGYLRGFQVAGQDRVFHWAQAKIKGNTVEVICDDVPEPVAIRYGWADNPGEMDLLNSAGLPAAPFRTDDWPGMTKDKTFDAAAARF